LNFGSRKQINIDENEDTFASQNELENIMKRGARLQEQMAQAMEPSQEAWASIHGIHNIPKNYVPPFMKEEHKEMAGSPIRDKLYSMQVDAEATGQL